MGGVCTSKRETIKLSTNLDNDNLQNSANKHSKPVSNSNRKIIENNKVSSSLMHRIDQFSQIKEQFINNELKEEENLLILRNNFQQRNSQLIGTEVSNKEKLKAHFFQKISHKKKPVNKLNRSIEESNSSLSKTQLVNNIHYLLNMDEDYYMTKKISFIILLKSTAIAYIDYLKENNMLENLRRYSNPIKLDNSEEIKKSLMNKGELMLRAKSLLPFQTQKSNKKSNNLFLQLSTNTSRFCLQRTCLEDAPDFNLLPILDDIEVIYLKENELQKKLQIIKCFVENDVYCLYTASYEINKERIISLFTDDKSVKSSSSLDSSIQNNLVLLKVYKDKKIFIDNINFLYRNYYKNYLRPDEIIIVDNTQYLIYKKKLSLLSDDMVNSEKMFSYGRDLLLVLEYSHLYLNISNFKLMTENLLLYNKSKYEFIVYIHEFSNIIESKVDNEQYKHGLLDDLYSIGAILYKLAFGYYPDLLK